MSVAQKYAAEKKIPRFFLACFGFLAVVATLFLRFPVIYCKHNDHIYLTIKMRIKNGDFFNYQLK